MPNRILREGILTSERVEALSWAEEVFYRRLMSVVDDFGRYYARPALLRAACYPLLLTKVSDSDIEKWLSACENAALVRVYPASDGKRYLQLLDFRQQVRAASSKFPVPPGECVADAQQVHVGCAADAQQAPVERSAPAQRVRRSGAASAHLGVSVFGDVVEGAGDAGASAREACQAMKQAGVGDAKPSHPKLAALLRAGATVEELEAAAADAVRRGKGFVYALGVAEGRRRDAAGLVLPVRAPDDPDSRKAVEAEAKAKGIGPWSEVEQWASYKARVRDAPSEEAWQGRGAGASAARLAGSAHVDA